MVDSICNYRLDRDEDYYALLACDETSNEEQIITEYKLRAVKEHPDKNLDDPSAVERFKVLQRAREVLTDTVRRADYDKWRRSGLSISYKQWSSLKDSIKTTMHWASIPQTKPMIKSTAPVKHKPSQPGSGEHSQSKIPRRDTDDTTDYMIGNLVWQRDKGNELLKKFRNYDL